MADTPLYRLPSLQLRAELRARFGAVADAASTPWEGGLAEQALRADLQACDTYRHRHLEPLSLPIDVLHLSDDLSVSIDELRAWARSEEHTSELQSLMRISYAVFCLKKK